MPYRALAERQFATLDLLARELISRAPHLRVPVVQAVLQDASGAMNAKILALETPPRQAEALSKHCVVRAATRRKKGYKSFI